MLASMALAAPRLAALLLVLPLPAAATPSARAGSFRDLVPRRVAVAAVSSGLSFSFPLAAPGGSVPLEVPGGKGPLELVSASPSREPGKGSVTLRLRNGTGAALSGLRLDLLGAGLAGSPKEGVAAASRDLGITLPDPLWFGELPAGSESAPLLLEVDLPDGLPAEATVVLRGVVGGAAVAVDPVEEPEAARLFKAQLRSRRSCGPDFLEGIRGEGLARAASPILCLFAPDGTAWVVDASAASVKVYDGRSGFLRSFGPSAGARVEELSFGSGGRVHLYEAGERPGSAVLLRTLVPF
jgi:hypothetical protein